MRSQVKRSQGTGNFRKMDIGHLAEFLNIKLGNIDNMNADEQAHLLQKLVALSQLKLTRLGLRY